MTGSFSNYLENKILDHIMTKAEYEMLSTVYIALCTAAPTDASTGSTIVEPSGGSYARLEVDPDDLNNASNGSITNNSTMSFPSATASWGTITHFAVCDALTGGNMLVWGEVTPSIPIPTGSIVSFDAGNFEVTLD